MRYISESWDALVGTANWVLNSILFQVPWYTNYFWGLIFISFAVWSLELMYPWRKNQGAFRKDFWMDGFYMFFNFFVFAIVISAVYKLLEMALGEIGVTIHSLVVIDLSSLPSAVQLLIFFVVLDFVQWLTHIALHRWSFFWQFHKVHHSVRQMGFAAHLRYHWMENILYKPLKTLGVMLIGGFEPSQAYIVHFLAITIGHLNHANVKLTWGPLKYLFNNPVMHLWHHALHLPADKAYGVNYGISLSLWDYLFKTNYIPNQEGDIELGFDGIERFPTSFLQQLTYGFKREKED